MFWFRKLTDLRKNNLSKPPHEAAQPDVKRQTPTAWGSDKEKPAEKKDKTDRL